MGKNHRRRYNKQIYSVQLNHERLVVVHLSTNWAEPLPDTSDSAPCDYSGSSRGVSGVGFRMVLSVSDSLISDENQAIGH